MCPRNCLQLIQLHSSKQFCMQLWAADVTHACVNTSAFLQQGWSSDWVLLNNGCTHQKSHWLQPFSYSLLKTLWRMVTPSFCGHSRGLTHKYEQNKIRWLKWLQPQLCPHCPIPRRSSLQAGWLWKASPELLEWQPVLQGVNICLAPLWNSLESLTRIKMCTFPFE